MEKLVNYLTRRRLEDNVHSCDGNGMNILFLVERTDFLWWHVIIYIVQLTFHDIMWFSVIFINLSRLDKIILMIYCNTIVSYWLTLPDLKIIFNIVSILSWQNGLAFLHFKTPSTNPLYNSDWLHSRTRIWTRFIS